MLTNTAKIVRQAPRAVGTLKPQGVSTIDALFRAEAERQQQPPKAAVLPVVAVKGTLPDPPFPPTHPEIKKFTDYLQSYDGERKPERKAEAMVIDVSKFWEYVSPEKVNWLHVIEPPKVRE